MKKMCLMVWAALLCGCPHHHPRDTFQPLHEPEVAANRGTPTTTTRDSEPAAPKVEAVPKAITDESPAIPSPRRNGASVIPQINGELQDAFFEYDRADLRPGGLSALEQDAALLIPILREFPEITVIVEGHCDERGSAEYNLGLGDHRGARATAILQDFGVPTGRVQRVSYGKERPQCTEPVESCWQRNRRVHVLLRMTP